MNEIKHIARIKGNLVRCLECLKEDDSNPDGFNENGSRLYLINLLPYKQTCHVCGKILSAGQSPSWCELFPKE